MLSSTIPTLIFFLSFVTSPATFVIISVATSTSCPGLKSKLGSIVSVVVSIFIPIIFPAAPFLLNKSFGFSINNELSVSGASLYSFSFFFYVGGSSSVQFEILQYGFVLL